MRKLDRRAFLLTSLGGLLTGFAKRRATIQTINGAIAANQLGKALVHEHFLVDFIGADKINEDRWNPAEVAAIILPYLQEVKQAGVKSIFDCTPTFLGRDVRLLQLLAQKSGLQIITNTGYYGVRDNKYLPPWAFSETAAQLAQRWITEFKNGIENTSIRPGFIKIGVDGQMPLSQIHQKLVRAAALTHLATGLTIFSHTGPGPAAFEQINILQQLGVKPDAFVWVHAQSEQDKSLHLKAAKQGAWVSLDGIGWGDFENYADSLLRLKTAGLLHRVLISHDAGWYKPQESQADFQGYTNIFKELFPRLKQKGFTDKDFEQLLVKNPATAMRIQLRKL
ncbi:phosphotriesterase family protein [Adhaeribacter rhizoryzae]|uniref:Phosphotriesterase n=1 Tax=Adhaeribacter rhizoryzae TaxID=2607907 RepID=A0A5M6D801_9BACT|nr:phosphotriesterase [Adhaeribacter rhizoryzae]KAA5541305.1 phosphotriesterase [Adhaeribacter rhizoryzae]